MSWLNLLPHKELRKKLLFVARYLWLEIWAFIIGAMLYLLFLYIKNYILFFKETKVVSFLYPQTLEY